MDKSISQHHSQQFSKTTKALTGDANDNGKCSHKVIMKDMCCICGRNLRPEGGFSGERNEPTTANVSMIHHVPELVVSKEIADELGARDHENIVRQRRLILLLDLDQTLVHTANRPLRAEEMGASDLTVYRLNGKYFDYRILSRDELLSSMHKTGNLKALFPCSEQMILMLDDRPDVWMHSDALIRVKPYRFFMEVGDINAPPQELLDSAETSDGLDKARNLGEEELKEESAHRQLLSKDGEENAQTKEKEQTMDEKTMAKSAREGEMPENRPETVERTLTEPIGAIVDEDNALVHVERVLSEVHSLFYQQYDRDKKIPDVKRILAWLRFQVLCGEQIVFSGIIPLGVDVKACEIYRMCTRFGAKVGDRIVERKTTVLVAARAATEKFRHAQRLRIPIVSTLWLDACFERWQRVDKRDFLFREEDEQQTATPSGESKFNEQEEGAGLRKRMAENKTTEMGGSSEEAAEVKRHRLSSISLCLDEKMDHFAQMDTISTKTLHEMESEVDSVLSDGDEDDDNEEKTNDDGESSTTSADYSETGEAFTVDSDRRNEEETRRELTDYGDEDTTRDSAEQDDEVDIEQFLVRYFTL
uniref:protein-serine/threonine phosphatase n=1 Tax=Globodera pallida TaxID=36090 RepID=A0A183BVQ3_GLOPA